MIRSVKYKDGLNNFRLRYYDIVILSLIKYDLDSIERIKNRLGYVYVYTSVS
jgi:hypothetical protein